MLVVLRRPLSTFDWMPWNASDVSHWVPCALVMMYGCFMEVETCETSSVVAKLEGCSCAGDVLVVTGCRTGSIDEDAVCTESTCD